MYIIGLISVTALFAGCADKSEEVKRGVVEVVEYARKNNFIERIDNDLILLAKFVQGNNETIARGDVGDQTVALAATSALWNYFELPQGPSARREFDGVAALIGSARKRYSTQFDVTLFDSVVTMLDKSTRDPQIVAKFPYYGVYEFVRSITHILTDPILGIQTNVTDSLVRASHSHNYTVVDSLAWDVVPLIKKIRPLLQGITVGENAEKLVFVPLFVLLSQSPIPFNYQVLFSSALHAGFDLFELIMKDQASAEANLKDTLARINFSPKELEMLQNIGSNSLFILSRLGLQEYFDYPTILKYIL